MRPRLPLPVNNSKVASTGTKSSAVAAASGRADSNARMSEIEHELQERQPRVVTASAPLGMTEVQSYDQFDDAEDDLPVPVPSPPLTPSQAPTKSDDVPTIPPMILSRESFPTPSSQESRKQGGKRSSKNGPRTSPPPNLKKPPSATTAEIQHDPHCDADALETLAMACLQERKERPKIEKGEQVEQDQVTRTDVLCGRGGMTNHHPGNVFYRRVVRLKQESYVVAAKRKKVEIATDIVQIIRCLSPPGRFLRKDDNDPNLWIEIGDKAAIAKTSQALREGAPDIRNLVVGNQSTGESSAPPGGNTKGLEAPAISDRAKQILASVRKKFKGQTSEFDVSDHDHKRESLPHQQNKLTSLSHHEQKFSPQTSPQQATEGPESWEQAPHGTEGWSHSFGSTQSQALALQEGPHRALSRMQPNLHTQRLAPPYMAPPHMQLPPGHVAVIPPGCPIPPGFMLLAPAHQPQLIPVHQMVSSSHGVQIGGRMMDPLTRSLYGHYFVPHGHAPPDLMSSAHLLSRMENNLKRKQRDEPGSDAEEAEDDEEDEDRDEHGQQVSGSEED